MRKVEPIFSEEINTAVELLNKIFLKTKRIVSFQEYFNFLTTHMLVNHALKDQTSALDTTVPSKPLVKSGKTAIRNLKKQFNSQHLI